MKEQIVKILNISKKLQTIRNEVNKPQEELNVIDFLNKIPEKDLLNYKEKIEINNPEKINKIRLMVVNWLLENRKITIADVERIKSEVASVYEEKILHSWKSYFSLFLPLIYQEKADSILKIIGEDVITKLGFDSLVKLKVVGFDGANNFGADIAWIAIYNKNQPNQSTSLQIFISFSGNNIDFGLYRYADKKRQTQRIVDIADFDYVEMISTLEKDKQKIIDDNNYVKCWKFSPGENSIHWAVMSKLGVAAIGWGNHSFAGKSRDEIQKLLPDSKSKSKGIVKLFFDAKEGDRILAFQGRNSIIGYGVIIKVGLYSEQTIVPDVDYHNYHEVKWTKVNPAIEVKTVAIDTFSDISDRWAEISKSLNLDVPGNKTDNQQMLTMKSFPLNQILYGPPGTGKTYNTINKALEIIGVDTVGITREQVKDIFDSKVKEGQIVFTTFHQSMCYEDFIEGIKPIEPKVEGQPVIYKVVDGIFKKLCKSANLFYVGDLIGSYEVVSFSSEILTLKKPNGSFIPFSFSMLYTLLNYLRENNIEVQNFNGKINPVDVDRERYPQLEKYLINGYPNIIPNILRKLDSNQQSETKKVLIIDEINRGNVSQIFGELITLIEEDKRLGSEEALEATLPYSKEKFGVPSNLYIIGTMNTADRSVEALDAALRRRFSFEEMPPKSEFISTNGKLKETNGILKTIDLPFMLDIINKRIEKLLDKDHQIGHSYFMAVSDLTQLKSTFQNKIIPLLQEYFFGDYGKVGLVLGKGFFEVVENPDRNLFADFDNYDASDFVERTIYKIKNISNMTEVDFHNAINMLLKKSVENQ